MNNRMIEQITYLSSHFPDDMKHLSDVPIWQAQEGSVASLGINLDGSLLINADYVARQSDRSLRFALLYLAKMKAGEYMEKRKDKEAWIWNVAVHHYITHQLSAYVPEILELPEDHLFDSSYASKLPEEIYDLLLKQLQSEDTQAM